MLKILILLTSIIILENHLFAQEVEPKSFTVCAYAEVYYQQDFNPSKSNKRPSFVYSHPRNHEVSLNLAYLKANYKNEKVRANLAVAVGSYMNVNYSAEEGVLKNIYESNIGVKLSKKHSLWLDAGIIPSHIGFESAISKDCFTLTRSIMAENSPYFETGAKLTYNSKNNKWDVAILALNGWQRIQRVEGNTTPAFGHQLTFRPNNKVTLNSSSFIGNDLPDSLRVMRYFHDFYAQFALNKKLSLINGFDFGFQQKEKKSSEYKSWYGAVVILKYQAMEKMNISARGEYFSDKNGVIVSNPSNKSFQTYGFSLNVDYIILPNLVWRTEVKNLNSKYAVFQDKNDEFNKNNFVVVTSLAIQF